jgi:hypothetical protein
VHGILTELANVAGDFFIQNNDALIGISGLFSPQAKDGKRVSLVQIRRLVEPVHVRGIRFSALNQSFRRDVLVQQITADDFGGRRLPVEMKAV